LIVSGKIQDQITGQPLPGASITLINAGGKYVVRAGSGGIFSFNLANENKIVFSHVGYDTAEYAPGDLGNYTTVNMVPNYTTLPEIVIKNAKWDMWPVLGAIFLWWIIYGRNKKK